MTHWRHRRDNNHHALVQMAERLGAYFFDTGPFDGWAWVRGSWKLVEIKDPKLEGQKREYTDLQVRIMGMLRERGIPWTILRTEEDVYRMMGARRTA